MLNVKKILFPTDFSDGAARAFTHARFLADWHKAEVHALHVNTDGLERMSGIDRSEEVEKELVERLSWAGGRLKTTCFREPSVPRGIVETAEEEDTDLIVMGTHGRRGIQRQVIGSVAERVVRSAPCPVLTVRTPEKQKADEAAPDRPEADRPLVERLLVPIDLSGQARFAIAHAVELAQTYGARIDLLHVVDERALIGGYEQPPVPVEGMVEEAEEKLRALAVDHIGYEHILAEVRPGVPRVTISEAAREHEADLIVIPTHGRTGLRRMIMGSVAENVVRTAPCPVFTLKSFGKSLLPESLDEDGDDEATPLEAFLSNWFDY